MAYIQSEKEEFVRRMMGAIKQGKQDETPELDHSFPTNPPPSTYSRNLEKLYRQTKKRMQAGEDLDSVLTGAVENLRPPYREFTREIVQEFKSAGATSKDVLEALIGVYEQV